VHYNLPFLLFNENGRLFPYNIVPIVVAFLFAFPPTMDKENYKIIIKFSIGLIFLYSALIITLEFPMILPFVKLMVGDFFPFAFSIILFLSLICFYLYNFRIL